MIINHIILYFSSNIKVAICSMAKKENLYIKEYIDYYIKLGVDHIYIYDNNDDNTEQISDIIGNSYKNYVTIYENIKDNINNYSLFYNSCYNNLKDKFNWIIMNDIDEYLVIKNDNLKNYLSNKIFKKCDFIKIHFVLTTDNNLIYYEKRPLFERFKSLYKNSKSVKNIVRGTKGLKYVIHSSSESPLGNNSCNNVGKKYIFNKSDLNEFDEYNYDKAYIIHYKYKSTEEFINKLKRDYNKWFDYNFLSKRIEEYFTDNEPTLEKVEFFEKQLKLNLSKYKEKYFHFNKINGKHLDMLYNIDNFNHNNTLKKNLLIGVLANYKWDVVEPFFESFKRAGFENCDFILFVNNIQLEAKKKIQSFGVIIYEVPNTYKNYNVINYRWKIYEVFLKENNDKYNLVFTTDLRDSIFQKDVFKYYDNKQSFLGVALEDGIIFDRPINKRWIINAYGKDVLNKIGNERIICVGTVWGTLDKFLEFSTIMWEKLSSEWSLKFNVIEQGVANFLIYYAKMFNECLIKSDNQNGKIMTIGISKRENINLDSENNIINGKGEIAAVIHQYDRKIDIVEKIKKKFCFEMKNNNSTINI